MTKVLLEQQTYTNIANAIRNRNNSQSTYTPGEMAEAISNLDTWSITNGIVEYYKANTTTINANTFVEFINNINWGTDTAIQTGSSSILPYTNARAIEIDTNKVFIVYNGTDTSSMSAEKGFYGVICSISNDIITIGSPTAICITTPSGISLNITIQLYDIIKIDTNKVFIVYDKYARVSFQNQFAYSAVICTVNGTTITVGTSVDIKALGTKYSSTWTAKATKIDNEKVLVTFKNNTDSTALYGNICTFSGTTITIGTSIATGLYYLHDIVLIDTNKIFISYKTSASESTLSGVIGTIDGTTFTIGTPIELATYYAGQKIILLENNKILILHYSNSENHYLNALICNINGDVINVGTDTSLILVYVSDKTISLIDENKIIIAYTISYNDGSYELIGVPCSINNDVISKFSNDIILNSTDSISPIDITLINTNRLFLSHRSNLDLNGIILNIREDISSDVPIQKSITKINGITKTQCTTSTAGAVYVFDNN